MKIAYVCADRGVPVFDWKKGCSIHVQEVVRALRRLGHTVDLFATNISGHMPDDFDDVSLYQLPCVSSNIGRGDRELAQLAANRSLDVALSSSGPYDLVYERYSLWSYAAMEYAAAQGIPGILEVNSPLIEEQDQFRGLIHRQKALRVAIRCFAAASKICAVSDAVADYLSVEFGVAANVAVIPNGVDLNRFAGAGSGWRAKTGRFTVGFVGSLKPWHGVNTLVDAFVDMHRHCPMSHLLIVGDGPERPSIEAQIARHKIESAVTLTGAVCPAEISKLLGVMDVGVAPYPKLDTNYFSPMKVFEYMAAGLPVVVSATGQLTDIIRDECNGLLCEPGNAAALSEALLCLIRDLALGARLGRAARQDVELKYTWAKVAAEILKLSALHMPQTAAEVRRVAP